MGAKPKGTEPKPKRSEGRLMTELKQSRRCRVCGKSLDTHSIYHLRGCHVLYQAHAERQQLETDLVEPEQSVLERLREACDKYAEAQRKQREEIIYEACGAEPPKKDPSR